MKKEIRKKLIEKRLMLTEAEVQSKSQQIIENLLNQFCFNDLDVVALYYPFKNEVNSLPLIEYLLKQNKKVVLPKVLSKTTMAFYEIKNLTDVTKSKFGVLEPTNDVITPSVDIDIMLIPGVGFNHHGYRLGYGAGYYDRYLVDQTFPTVGVCFDLQLNNDFEIDVYDIPLNFVITESHQLQHHNVD